MFRKATKLVGIVQSVPNGSLFQVDTYHLIVPSATTVGSDDARV